MDASPATTEANALTEATARRLIELLEKGFKVYEEWRPTLAELSKRLVKRRDRKATLPAQFPPAGWPTGPM